MASTNGKGTATAAVPPQQNPETLLYFAFGSNLSSTQMRSRCPGAAAVGLAFLPGYKFIINERGFANVVPSTATTTTTNSSATATTPEDGVRRGGVYGVLYRLASPAEKERLDGYEGVPWAYEDLVLDVEQLSGGGVSTTGAGATSSSTTVVRALVYVDRARVTPSAPRAEYAVRMNAGIREAGAEWGLPGGYVRDVMRRYIPAADDDATPTAGGGGGGDGRSRAKDDRTKPSGMALSLTMRPKVMAWMGRHFTQFLQLQVRRRHVASRYSLPYVMGKPTTAMKKVKNRQSDFHRKPPRPSARRQDLEEDRGRDHHHSLYSC